MLQPSDEKHLMKPTTPENRLQMVKDKDSHDAQLTGHSPWLNPVTATMDGSYQTDE